MPFIQLLSSKNSTINNNSRLLHGNTTNKQSQKTTTKHILR